MFYYALICLFQSMEVPNIELDYLRIYDFLGWYMRRGWEGGGPLDLPLRPGTLTQYLNNISTQLLHFWCSKYNRSITYPKILTNYRVSLLSFPIRRLQC